MVTGYLYACHFLAYTPRCNVRMQAIVYQILSEGDDSFSHISNYSPFFEVDRTWEGNKIAGKYAEYHAAIGTRAFNTHLRWEVMPKRTGGAVAEGTIGCKYIYVYRDGRDACTSFYHHLSSQADAGSYERSFDEFVRDWLGNKIPFGSWAEHLKGWIEAAADPTNNILIVNYEDMILDIENAVIRVSKFLGRRADPEYIRGTILPHVSIDYMRAHRAQYDPVSVVWKDGFQFIRKGVVGDHQNSFTPEHMELYNAMLARAFPDVAEACGYDLFFETARRLASR